jgi:hypothetical protein
MRLPIRFVKSTISRAFRHSPERLANPLFAGSNPASAFSKSPEKQGKNSANRPAVGRWGGCRSFPVKPAFPFDFHAQALATTLCALLPPPPLRAPGTRLGAACANDADGAGDGGSMTSLRILSLGAGVQSTTLLLMSIRGELPRVDHAIFADTQWEPPAVYRHLEWLKGEAERAGIPVHVVTAGNLRADAIAFRRQRYSEDPATGRKGYASIPLFVLNPDGSQGMIRRQCTKEYKIEPIEKFIKRELLGLTPRQRAPRESVIEQWFGITWDECERMRNSTEPWKTHVYPFCGPEFGNGYLAKRWRRHDCVDWLKAHYPDRDVPRSACIGCSYRTNEEWTAMRDNDPASFADAVAFDHQIRVAQREGVSLVKSAPFIHRQMVPLADADLRSDVEKGQGLLGFVNECEGMCGV